MSLLGEPWDSIVQVIYAVIGGIAGLIAALVSILGKLITLIYYLFITLEVIISIILNPYLLLLVILGTAFYYAAFTAKTRKELITKTGEYYHFVLFVALPKTANAIYTLAVRIVVGIIDMI